MKSFIDEITGLQAEPLEREDGLFMVVRGHAAYSVHNSRAEARAHIAWKWKRLHPEINFEVIPI